jgi:integrase
VNKERNNLLAVWRFACRRKGADGLLLRTEWPNVESDIEPEDDPVAWLQHELAALFQKLSGLAGYVGVIPASLWWLALHSVIWDSGERISATMLLTWGDIDLDQGWIRFRATTRKGKRRGKTHKLHADTIIVLSTLKAAKFALPDNPVFPWPYCTNYLWFQYKRILQAAGLPSDRKCKFHRMRRSVASWAEAAGLSAMNLLGHSRPQITRQYIDPRIVKSAQASDVLFRPGKNEGELLDRSGM